MTTRLPRWLQWVGLNLVFAVCHPGLSAAWLARAPLANSLLVNAMLFVLPAVGWAGVFQSSRRLGSRLVLCVFISAVVFLLCLTAIRALGLELTTTLAWNAVWLVGNLGFLCAVWIGRPLVGRRSLTRRELALGGILFFASYGLFFWGATRVVPPQSDHDFEMQATGFALMHRLEPLLVTNRGPLYYFAHPPLLHFYVGESFLLYGKLDELKFHDDVSRRALAERNGLDVPPADGRTRLVNEEDAFVILDARDGNYLLMPEHGGESRWVPQVLAESGLTLQRYEDNPSRLETRTPNLFLAAVTVALLGLWVGRLSHRWWIGLLAAVAYATSPEIFVRSSYGGYFAIGVFATIAMLLGAHGWRRRAMPTLAGAFAAVADHKLVLLPVAHGAQLTLSWLRQWRFPRFKELLHPVVIGFALGTCVFWAYGLLISPLDFYVDHLRHHLVNRIAHQAWLPYSGYPTPLELWREFMVHTGYVVLPLSLGLLAYDLFVARTRVAPHHTSSRSLWFLYVMLSATAFTVVDWRMTKHLIVLLPVLYLALAPARLAEKWRVALPVVVMGCAILYNVFVTGELTRNFDSFKLVPSW